MIDIPKKALLKEAFEESTLEKLTIYGSIGCNQCHQGLGTSMGEINKIITS